MTAKGSPVFFLLTYLDLSSTTSLSIRRFLLRPTLPIVCSQALDPAVFLGLCDISLSDYHCSSSHGDAIVIISKRWNSAVVCFEDHLDVLASFKFNFQTWLIYG